MLQQIAEIGQAHDGSLGLAHSYIDSLKGSSVTSIKFQIHIASAESSKYEEFRVPFSFEDKSRYDYWKRMEFTKDQWIGLKNHCEDLGFEFLASPFSVEALELLDELKVKRIKIGSGETSNYLLLDKIKISNKEILLSTGLSSLSELNQVIEYLNYNKITIFHCTTSYPSTKENFYLDRISILKEMYKDRYKIGFSDHSGDPLVLAAGLSLGAELLEYHIVFDKKSFGPDSSSSIEIRDIHKISESLNNIYISLNDFKFSDYLPNRSKVIFGKSIAVNRDIRKGDVIVLDYLETKKPGGKGIHPMHYKNILGKKLKRNILKDEFLNFDDLL